MFTRHRADVLVAHTLRRRVSERHRPASLTEHLSQLLARVAAESLGGTVARAAVVLGQIRDALRLAESDLLLVRDRIAVLVYRGLDYLVCDADHLFVVLVDRIDLDLGAHEPMERDIERHLHGLVELRVHEHDVLESWLEEQRALLPHQKQHDGE